MGKFMEWLGKRVIAQEEATKEQEKLPDRWESMKDIWHTTFSRANVGDSFEQFETILGAPDTREVKGEIVTYKYTYLEYKKDADPVHHKMEFDIKSGAIFAKRSKNV